MKRKAPGSKKQAENAEAAAQRAKLDRQCAKDAAKYLSAVADDPMPILKDVTPEKQAEGMDILKLTLVGTVIAWQKVAGRGSILADYGDAMLLMGMMLGNFDKLADNPAKALGAMSSWCYGVSHQMLEDVGFSEEDAATTMDGIEADPSQAQQVLAELTNSRKKAMWLCSFLTATTASEALFGKADAETFTMLYVSGGKELSGLADLPTPSSMRA